MNSKSLRRLAADHGSLHTAGLPPNYLFPPSNTSDELTSLDVLLVGPVGTPYAKGVWRLHLDIPPTYPTAPPTATFRTRLWHPNIDEATGAVCVETLKRDWSSTLKLRDVLVTISCLLIQPNPASALNEAAGKLASEDWDGFCRRAKLMTDIHAAIPGSLAEEVKAAQMRGEDKEEPSEKEEPVVEVKGKGKGKESVRATPAASSKMRNLSAEDEENRRRRGDTIEPVSDPESDWIPGPTKAPKPLPAPRRNILGIKGLDDSMQLEAEQGSHDETDPFVMVASKRGNQLSFSLKVPPVSGAESVGASSKVTPELSKFSHCNPYSAIQPNNQIHPLLAEFSWSWQDSEIMHSTGTIKDGPTKTEVRKRLASTEFEKKRRWELKKFKKAGYDLNRYNKGDFGPKTGMGRL